MITSIRRRFSKPASKDLWAADLVFEPEPSRVSEVASDNSVLLTSKLPTAPPSNDVDLKGYYRGLIRTAIQHGGRHQGQQISIPWLRMTLAGLEMRPIPPEMMWEGEQEGSAPELSDYDRLFPSGSSSL